MSAYRLLCVVAALVVGASWAGADLRVTAVAEPPQGARVIASQPLGRKGPTSIRYLTPSSTARGMGVSPNPADPNAGKYYVQDRDLGQTFSTPAGPGKFKLDAITLRVGVTSPNGSIRGAMGAKVSLQVFKVTGTPQINDNGTTGATIVSKAYTQATTAGMADDYITGESYSSLCIARGGVLPDGLEAGEGGSISPTPRSRGSLLRWDLRGEHEILMDSDSVYAFLVMFDEPSETERALPLDNWDFLNQRDVPMEKVKSGPYAQGHAIRRAGRIDKPWQSAEKLKQALNGGGEDKSASAFPADFVERCALTPGTWGRPDVDSYRDLVFFVEADRVMEAP